MTTPKSCPSADITAFIAGYLDAEGRQRLIEHMTACSDCRQVLMASPRFRAKTRMGASAIAAASLLAIAAVVIAINGYPLLKRWLQGDMDAVVEASAALRYRPSLARLSANFEYRSVGTRKRGGTKDNVYDPQYSLLWPVIDRLSREPGSIHALGVSHLLTGDVAGAVRTLEQAVRNETNAQGEIGEALRRSTNAALLNDLAASYEALIEQKDDVTFRPSALEAIQRAWSIEKTPAIAWTRAVIIDGHHVHEESVTAWREYLVLEPRSRWSEFAQRRLHDLEKPTDYELWPSVKRRLTAMGNDDSELYRGVDRFRQDVRLWCEDELLPKWADALLRNDASAPEQLAKIVALGGALERAGGEREVTDAVDAIRKATPPMLQHLARGHMEYGAGRRAQMSSDAAGALRAMDAAAESLTPQLTPFAWRVRIEHAAAVYTNNDYDRARTELQQLPPEATLSTSCRGRVDTLLGIVALQTGAYEKAIDHYTRAIEAYAAIGERDYEATLLSRLATALEFAGDADAARTYRERAVQLLDRLGDPRHRHDVMVDAAVVAFNNGQYAAAALYFDRVIANNFAAKDYDAACGSLMWRSAYRYRRNLMEAATADLDNAQRVCGSIADRAVRERMLANLELAKLIVAAPASGDAAIDYFKRTNSHVWLRTAYLVRARRRAERGERAAAERDFRAALAETEASREQIDDRHTRMEFTATSDEVVDDYVDFLLQQRRDQEAFELADHHRLRELVDSPTARWRAATGSLVPRIEASLPSHGAFVEYRVLGKKIVAWVIRAEAFHAVTLPEPIDSIKRTVAAIDAETPEPELRTKATLLYDGLLRPVEPLLKDATALVIVPDSELERVPYSALYDRVKRRYLVEACTATVAPSAVLFLESQARSQERSTGDRMLIVRASAADATSAALPEAAAEVRSIVRIYPNARVLDGSGQTGPTLLSQARGASFLQFVGHTRMTRDGGSLALRLGDAERSQVTMADVLAAPLPRLRLVYLSACETDRGPVLKSEGSVTIARSFFAAGVPTVVGTLWPLDDANARMASTVFHEHLRSGDNPAESLRQAQLALLSHERGSRVDWAALRVIGAGL